MQRKDWDSYFIDIAKSIAQRSTCLRRNYGAVIVKDNVIVSTGYNGACRGEENCCDKGFCIRQQMNIPAGERYELCVAIHAEQNAIIAGSREEMKDATIYIAGFEANGDIACGKPCMICSRMIKNAMIMNVIYLDKDGSLVSYMP